MSETSPYPQDLMQAQREFYALQRQLDEIPPRPYTVDGEEHRADGGWTPELQEQADRLHARMRDVAATLATHSYWGTLSDRSEVPGARMHLKQQALMDQPDTAHSV